MSNKIIIVGAGPIGLWTAIQLKLENRDLAIIIKEKRAEYNRKHPLWLSPQAFSECRKDDYGIINSLIQQLQKNPHISTKKLQETLTDLAKRLGIEIEHAQEVQDIDRDLLVDHPDTMLIIGADSIHSTMNNHLFGHDNTNTMPLAYAVQVKYQTQGHCLEDRNIFEFYPILKHSHYLASVNHGKIDEQEQTSVTIQFLIDKLAYDALRAHHPQNQPINLFVDDIQDTVPAKLLADIKTQMGYRLKHDENILVDTVKLTTTELPQQRRHRTTVHKNGRYYALIGDAALGLSFFKGLNSGLQLATHFAKTIVKQWRIMKEQNPNALVDYDTHYNKFADHAVMQGYQTNYMLKFFRSFLTVSAMSPVQSVYIEPNDIAELHRCFDIIHQVSHFCLELQEHKSSTQIKSWLETQMPIGLVILQKQLISAAEVYRHQQPLLHQALLVLASIDQSHLNFYERAYLGLAMSKTKRLLETPSPEEYHKYLKFLAQVKPANSSFAHIFTVSLLFIAGVVGVTLGVGAGLGFVGLSLPLGITCMIGGALLFGLGQYHYQMKPKKMPSQTCIAVEAIAEELRPFVAR